MSTPNIKDPNFANSKFPGPLGASNAQIDEFVEMVDTILQTSVADESKAWAQYYNAHRNALVAATNYIYISPSVTCPVTSASASGDGSIGILTKPYTYSFPLNNLMGFVATTQATQASGQILPFELIVVASSVHPYNNTPNKEYLVVEDSTLYNLLAGTHNWSLCLSVVNSTYELNADPIDPGTDVKYPSGYINSISIHSTQIQASSAYIFSGVLIDHYGVVNKTSWDKGEDVNLVLSVVKL